MRKDVERKVVGLNMIRNAFNLILGRQISELEFSLLLDSSLSLSGVCCGSLFSLWAISYSVVWDS